MTQTRIYLPLRASDVADLTALGEVTPASAYAVTPAVRSDLPAEEEREHAAMGDAVAAAGALRSLDGRDGVGKRVVAAADVDESAVVVGATQSDHARSFVRLEGPVPLRRIVSLHIDEHPGSEGDLLWYDVTELAEVARLLFLSPGARVLSARHTGSVAGGAPVSDDGWPGP